MSHGAPRLGEQGVVHSTRASIAVLDGIFPACRDAERRGDLDVHDERELFGHGDCCCW